MTRTRMTTVAAAMALGTVAFAQSPAAPAGTTQASTTQTAKPAGPAVSATSKTLDALQGTWVFTTTDGNDMSGAPEVAVVITKDAYVQTVNGDVVERGQFKLDDTKTPMRMDLIIKEGQDAGATQLGVFEIKGTTMRGKLNTAGATVRPTDFEPAEGFFTFTAVKK